MNAGRDGWLSAVRTISTRSLARFASHLGREEAADDEVHGAVRVERHLRDERVERGLIRGGVVRESAAGGGLGGVAVAGHVGGDADVALQLELLHELGVREAHEPGAVHEEHLVRAHLHALLGDAEAIAPVEPARGDGLDGLRQRLHHLPGVAVEDFVVRRAGGADGRGGGAARRARRAARRGDRAGDDGRGKGQGGHRSGRSTTRAGVSVGEALGGR